MGELANVRMEVDDNDVLHLWVDLKQNDGLTNDGKKIRIASTHGDSQVHDGKTFRPEVVKLTVVKRLQAGERERFL